MPDAPLEHLAELLAALQQRRAPSDAAADWWVSGVQAGLRDGGTLDQALGLSSRGGGRGWRVGLLQTQRDHHLARAARAVALDEGASDWSRCRRLAPLVRTFVADVWPRVKTQAEPPPEWPAWKRELFLAAQTGQPLPNSARGLHRALTRTPPCSCHAVAPTVAAWHHN